MTASTSNASSRRIGPSSSAAVARTRWTLPLFSARLNRAYALPASPIRTHVPILRCVAFGEDPGVSRARWNERHAEAQPGEPAGWIVEHEELIAAVADRRALDVACGLGRHAV